MNFGYKVINLGGTEIDTTGITIEGLGDEIASYLKGEKIIIIAGLNVDGYGDVAPYVPAIHVNSGSYIITLDNAYYLEVTSADLIKLVAYT